MVMRAFAQSTARRASTGGTSVRTRWIRRRLAAVTLVIALAAIALAPAGALAQFQLGLEDGFLSQMPATAQTKTAFGVLHQAAASTIRIPVAWSGVAPVTLPANFDPANPGDRHYHWGAVDAAVQNAVANGARPLLVIYTAPTWAQPANKPAYDTSPLQVAYEPNAQEYGRFAHAVAARYSGKFADPQSPTTILPRVKLFEIWNEENLKGSLDSPDLVTEYRSLLNASYARIKSVHPDNVVSVGGLAPVFVAHQVMSPLKFAARLMCLTRVRTHYVRAACPVQAHFDAFSIHPYSLASTPTLHAFLYDDTLVADMGKVRALLRAAEKLHTTQPHIPYALWVSEWSWFSNPPDELIGDPDRTAARYTAYGLYEMWKAGTNLVIWLKVLYPRHRSERDDPRLRRRTLWNQRAADLEAESFRVSRRRFGEWLTRLCLGTCAGDETDEGLRPASGWTQVADDRLRANGTGRHLRDALQGAPQRVLPSQSQTREGEPGVQLTFDPAEAHPCLRFWLHLAASGPRTSSRCSRSPTFRSNRSFSPSVSAARTMDLGRPPGQPPANVLTAGKRYRLVHTELAWVNAFFVREDLFAHRLRAPVRPSPCANYFLQGHIHPPDPVVGATSMSRTAPQASHRTHRDA